jgi:LysR family transcriptional regulator, regulator of abg operon
MDPAVAPMVDAEALNLIATIADAGSLSAAARRAGLTQPALTKQLARIERTLGVALFARSIRGVQPTEYGLALLPRARTVRAQLRQAAEELAQLRGQREGRVCIAISHLATIALLPQVISGFRAQWPEVALRVVSPAFPYRLGGLREGAPDFAISQLPTQPLGPEFVARPLLPTSIAVVVRGGHPLARVTDLASLAGAAWVVPSIDSATASAVFAAFDLAGLPAPSCPVTCETLTGMEALVGATDLLGAIPLEVYRARAVTSGLAQIPLADPIPGRGLALIHWADAKPTPAADDLAQRFIAAARDKARARPGDAAPMHLK